MPQRGRGAQKMRKRAAEKAAWVQLLQIKARGREFRVQLRPRINIQDAVHFFEHKLTWASNDFEV